MRFIHILNYLDYSEVITVLPFYEPLMKRVGNNFNYYLSTVAIFNHHYTYLTIVATPGESKDQKVRSEKPGSSRS